MFLLLRLHIYRNF